MIVKPTPVPDFSLQMPIGVDIGQPFTKITALADYITPIRHDRYTVQWSSDESFGSGSGEAKISALYDYGQDQNTWMTYTIEGVSESEPTYVRVIASNAVGFSEPAAAVPQGWSQHEVYKLPK